MSDLFDGNGTDEVERWRRRLVEIARVGIEAVMPRNCLADVYASANEWDRYRDQPYLLLAFGKAAIGMATATVEAFGPPATGVVVSHDVGHDVATSEIGGCTVLRSTHPVPSDATIAAGLAIRQAIEATDPGIPVVVLISGGASSLVDVLRPGIVLSDLVAANELLLRSGRPIGEVNIVRQALSAFKGGGLARWLEGRDVRTLLISDVVGNDEAAVGSGPMSRPDWHPGTPWDVVDRTFRAWAPPPVRLALQQGSPFQPPTTPIRVVADGAVCARAALGRALAYDADARLLGTEMDGNAATMARWLFDAAAPGISIVAGETTVSVTGTGRGGRNQHAALTWALDAQRRNHTTDQQSADRSDSSDWVGVAIGTDGRDGPTDAAGAVVDVGTVMRIRDRGGDPIELYRNDDSFTALELSGDVIAAQPTGTNVGDLWLMWQAPQ